MTHNIIEGDASPTRNDLYETGDAWTMDLEKFRAMLDAVPDGQDADKALVGIGDFAAERFEQSVASNPDFYYGPVSGMVARNAAFVFVTRLFSNHSSEGSAGHLSHAALKSFYGVTGDGADMQYSPGHERIPASFYRSPTDYTMVVGAGFPQARSSANVSDQEMNLDIVALVLRHPRLASIGGNTGEFDS